MTRPNIEILLSLCVRAYQLGEADTGKQRTQEALFNELRFGMRGGYRTVVWEAYKAGRFAAEVGDK